MFDIAIIGGGIIGLSTGMSLTKQHPDLRIVIIEKESDWAQHQTGRNSGVIHSGIYYQPNSFKARFAREGNRAIVDFCEKHDISYDVCGKVIVAVDEEELPLMDNLYERGLANHLHVRKIGREELREIEPHVNGLGAIHVQDCGIVDYSKVAQAFKNIVARNGGEFRLATKVENIVERDESVLIETNNGTIHARYLVI